MKKTKIILCRVNLVFFLVSFSLLCANNFTFNEAGPISSSKDYTYSAKHDQVSDKTFQLSEENETENENDIESEAFVLPFLLSHIQTEASLLTPHQNHVPVVKAVNPLYLQVRNFRI